MSYEPTKWQTGDIITLNKLNKLEQGVAAMMEEYEPTVWQIGDTVTSTKLNKLEQAVATLSESSNNISNNQCEIYVGMPNMSFYQSKDDIIIDESTDYVSDQNAFIYSNSDSSAMLLPAGFYAVITYDYNSSMVSNPELEYSATYSFGNNWNNSSVLQIELIHQVQIDSSTTKVWWGFQIPDVTGTLMISSNG